MVIHPSYYDACDVSCDVIYYVIAVRARRMVRIFFLSYLGNRSKSETCSYELFFIESHIRTIISQSIADSSWTTLYVAAPYYKDAAFYEDHKQQIDKYHAKLYIFYICF